MAATPALRPLSLGEVLDVSFGLYRSLFAPLLVIAVICQSLPMALGVYLGTSGALFVNLSLSLVYGVLAVIFGALGVAASTFVVSDAYLGRETSAIVALQRALSLLGRLVVISVLSSLLIGLGFWFNAYLRVGPMMASNNNADLGIRRFRTYSNLMAISGVLVLLLTALAQVE